MGGVERNPGPAKTIEDLDIKLNKITEIVASHASKTETRLENFDTKWSGLKKEVETMKQDIHKLQDLGWVERSNRKHNLIVYGLNEDINENRWDLSYKLLDLFNKELQINICDYMVDDCYRLGKKKNTRPVSISFTNTFTRDSILERAKLLKGTNIFLGRDHDYNTRNIRAQLIPYMRDARNKGKHAILRYDKLITEGKEVKATWRLAETWNRGSG